MDGETTCGSGCHRVVQRTKPVHACYPESKAAAYSQQQVNAPYPFGSRRESWVHFCLDGTSGLGSEHLDTSSYQ